MLAAYTTTLKPSMLLNMFGYSKSTKSLSNSANLCNNGCFVLTAAIFYFIVPTITFQQSLYVVNEDEDLKPVLVLTGLISINVTVAVLAKDGSAIGEHYLLYCI